MATNLLNHLYERCGENLEVKESDFMVYINQKVDAGYLPKDVVTSDIEVDDKEVDAYWADFNLWLKGNGKVKQHYIITISEKQRLILVDALATHPKTLNFDEEKLLGDLNTLPNDEESNPGSVWDLTY